MRPWLVLLLACTSGDSTKDSASCTEVAYFLDADGDTYTPADAAPLLSCFGPPQDNYILPSTLADCDDTDANTYPSADELCDDLDNDCDGSKDENLAFLTYYQDSDGDSYGDAAAFIEDCDAPSGFVVDNTDCDDTDAAINPGQTEDLCGDGIDADCNGYDEDLYYLDFDGDGYGVDTATMYDCGTPDGYATQSGDCDDTRSDVNPAAQETCVDPADEDCDGLTADVDPSSDAQTWYQDNDRDGDGSAASTIRACTLPDGYSANDLDCDDSDPSLSQDTTWHADNDGDGYGDASTTVTSCAQPANYVSNADDCDDGDATLHASSTWYADTDGDGYGDAASAIAACGQPAGFVADDSDCNDLTAAISPAAAEVCDGVDNDCDGTSDVGASDAALWYADIDGDGHGVASAVTASCTQPSGYVDNADDCDPLDAAISPSALEVCDDLDNDCDGDTDDADPDVVATSIWYADADGDGYGDIATTLVSCDAPSGYGADATDCDDDSSAVHPGATEICGDDVDADCDGSDGTVYYADADGDTFGDAANSQIACAAIDGYVTNNTDCDDANDDILNVVTWYADDDGDGYGDTATTTTGCDQPSGYVADDTDCDDALTSVYPSADETCNGLDDDCDGAVDDNATDAGIWYVDADADAYGSDSATRTSCTQPDGYVARSGDCNGADTTIYPGADETCDGIDQDCDGLVDNDTIDDTTWYLDSDGDGYGDPETGFAACDQPDGYIANDSDCNDSDAALWSSLSTWYLDADGDGYGDVRATTTACDQPDGYVSNILDCNDADAAISPVAVDVCDGIDNNCNGSIDNGNPQSAHYLDADGDGYGDPSAIAIVCDEYPGYVSDNTDCNDSDETVYPGAAEVCDGVDQDCDGVTEVVDWYADIDGDGYGDPSDTATGCDQPSGYVSDNTDCDDADDTIYPTAPEVCDGEDNDCDGTVDDSTVDQTYYRDADSDGYGNPSLSITDCVQRPGYVLDNTDCDDSRSAVNPGGTEVCDAADRDEDCDGLADDADGDVTGGGTYYLDSDGDGYGDADTATTLCEGATGYVSDDTDCNDGNSAIYLNAPEFCDGEDNDCDGTMNEAGTASFRVQNADDTYTWSDLSGDFSTLETDHTSVTIEESGTLYLCEGTFYTSLTLGDSNEDEISVVGLGSTTILDGGSANQLMMVSSNVEVSIEDLTLQNGHAAYYGGAIYVDDGAELDLVRVTVQDNTASSGGAILGDTGATVTITDSHFANNSATNHGGALYMLSAYLNLIGSTACVDGGDVDCETEFTDNTAVSSGGAVYLGGGITYVENTKFSGNAANSNGGAISGDVSALTIGDSYFIDNTALSGGALFPYYKNPTISGGAFRDNFAMYGGAIRANYGSNTGSITGVEFTNNSVNSVGGALYLENVTYTLSGNILTGNSSTGHGGAIYMTNGSTLSCDGDIFADNSAYAYGDDAYLNVTSGYGSNLLTSYDCDWAGSDTGEIIVYSGYYTLIDSYNPGDNATFTCTDAGCNEPTTWYADTDGDGYGDATDSVSDTDQPDGYVSNSDDCDDTDAGIRPSAADTCGDGIDNDCDGSIDTDGAYYYDGSTWSDVSSTLTGTFTLGSHEELYICGGTWDVNLVVADAATDVVIQGSNSPILDGGGLASVIEVGSYADVTIQGLALTNGEGSGGSGHGGGLYVGTYATVIASELEVYENTTYYAGGGIFVDTGADLSLSDSSVYENTQRYSDSAGGGIAISDASFNLHTVAIFDNQAMGYGGGISLSYVSNGTAEGLTLTANQTAGSGGGFYAYHSSFTMTDATISGNTADDGGGGGILSYSSGIFSHVTVEDNDGGSFYGGGGLALASYSTVQCTDCTFTTNQSNASGGAIATSSSSNSLTLTDSSFIENSTTTSGGAIYLSGGDTCTLTNTDFTSNRAPDGGAVYAQNSVITITDGSFDSNAATSSYGGAIRVYGVPSLSVSGTTFDNNTALLGAGGALSIWTTTAATISDASFNGNQAYSGGAIHVDGNGGEPLVRLSNTSLTNNTASIYGGAIFAGYTLTELSLSDGSVLTGNTAGYGGGISLRDDAEASCADSEISENSAVYGGDVYMYYSGASYNNILTSTVCDWLDSAGNTGEIYVNLYTGTDFTYAPGDDATFTCTDAGCVPG